MSLASAEQRSADRPGRAPAPSLAAKERFALSARQGLTQPTPVRRRRAGGGVRSSRNPSCLIELLHVHVPFVLCYFGAGAGAGAAAATGVAAATLTSCGAA